MADISNEKFSLKVQDVKNTFEARGLQYEMPLGKGSFSLVVQARRKLDKQRYAIKLLPIDRRDETKKYQKRELKVLTKRGLWIRNIVKYYDCWEDYIGSKPFLCIMMERCRVSLEVFVYNNAMGNAEIVKSQGPPRFYRQIFPQVLNGLFALHSLGLVHRDIHISNILIANPKPEFIVDINVKIADFGLSREIASVIDSSTSLTDALTLEKLSPGVGNKLFRAPELETEHYSYKVDLYSAGMVLYFLSRYLKEKKQWQSEFTALRNKERTHEHLTHKDDIILCQLFSLLLKEDPRERPSAEEALKYFSQDVSSKIPPPKSNVKERLFYIKKDGLTKRCLTNDDTIRSLKESIKNCIGIPVETHNLRQRTVIDGKEEVIPIETNLDVRCMFLSAERAETSKKKVIIEVSENNTEHNTDVSESVTEMEINGL